MPANRIHFTKNSSRAAYITEPRGRGKEKKKTLFLPAVPFCRDFTEISDGGFGEFLYNAYPGKQVLYPSTVPGKPRVEKYYCGKISVHI